MDWITVSVGFSHIVANVFLLLSLMNSNLAGDQILRVHLFSLSSLVTSLYYLLASVGTERAQSNQIFPPFL